MGIVLLAWVEQLGFLVLKQLIGTINCSCFCHSGHDAVSLLSIQILKCFYAASFSQMITMIKQQKNQEDLAIQLTVKKTDSSSNKEIGGH